MKQKFFFLTGFVAVYLFSTVFHAGFTNNMKPHIGVSWGVEAVHAKAKSPKKVSKKASAKKLAPKKAEKPEAKKEALKATPKESEQPKPASQTIEMTSSGFSPSAVTIAAGTTVTFVNKDSTAHWPASGAHPIHQICPSFDAMKALKTGETYSFTFKEKKECPLHDHLNPGMQGKITVK